MASPHIEDPGPASFQQRLEQIRPNTKALNVETQEQRVRSFVCKDLT
jgi:hypothetical protein